jgi:hypothetical protein
MANRTARKKEKVKRVVREQKPPKDETSKQDEARPDYGGMSFDNFNKNLGCGG